MNTLHITEFMEFLATKYHFDITTEHYNFTQNNVSLTHTDEHIIAVCAAAFDLSIGQVMQHVRTRHIVDCRKLIFKILRLNKTCKMAGSVFSVDHSTVIHSVQQFDDLYETDREFKRRCNSALTELGYAVNENCNLVPLVLVTA